MKPRSVQWIQTVDDLLTHADHSCHGANLNSPCCQRKLLVFFHAAAL